MLKKRCQVCGHEKIEKAFRLWKYTRTYPNGVTKHHAIRVKTCLECQKGQFSEAKKEHDKEHRAKAESREKVRCRDCLKEKPVKKEDGSRDDRYFFFRPNGLPSKSCRLCRTRWVRNYRKTRKYKRWLRKARPKRREQSKVYNRSPKGRLRKKKKPVPLAVAKARNRLSEAIERGEVRKPKECAKCGRGEQRLRAHFLRGHGHPFDVEFLCYHCFWEVVVDTKRSNYEEERMEKIDERELRRAAERTSGRYKVPFDLALQLTTTRREFAEVHAENVGRLRHDREPAALAMIDRAGPGDLELLAQQSEPRPNRNWRDLGPDERPEGSSLTMLEIMSSPFVRAYYPST